MKILFLGKRFYTNRDAYAERFGRIYQLPYFWSKAGEEVQLWLFDYHSSESVVKVDGTLRITTFPIVGFKAWGQLIGQCLFPGQFDVVIASGDCYVGMAGWLVAQRNKAMFVFDIYDKYDEFGGYRRLLGFDPFHFLTKHAHIRTFASQALPSIIGARPSADYLIPNGVDTNQFRPLDRVMCRQNIGLSEGMIYAGYFGSMEVDRGVDDLVDAVRLLRAKGTKIQALLGGKNPPMRYLEDPAIHYLGDMPFGRMPEVVACADVLVVPYRRSAAMDQGASCKIGEYIASGRPVVTTRTPNFLANLPQQALDLGGAVCEPENPQDLARAIAIQLTTPRYTRLPNGMDWKDISMKALARIQSQVSNRSNSEFVGNTNG
ncbi:glycosyl transferase [Novimethylophilus kurashikiensis]|uniref:Glycosyl transferase n=1 Tax=Novimethylophilus kurashikiensis TaxID=1825523 RepID=A0A2R5FBQ8_9PROT|nr:glycosyltransferase family 4 protein [Novimethylophilus kurashikiensis]GBG15670.1 glycosyl transferase [Novimethylophilus kurashikiensis]